MANLFQWFCPCLRLSAKRIACHWLLVIFVSIVLSAAVQTAIVVTGIRSAGASEPSVRAGGLAHWLQADIEIKNQHFVVIRRPLRGGALFAAVPSKSVYGWGVPSPERVRAQNRSVGADDSVLRVFLWPSGKSVRRAGEAEYQWVASVSEFLPKLKVRPSEGAVLSGYLAPDAEYSEVLMLGWPLPVVAMKAECAFADLYDGKNFTFSSDIIRVGGVHSALREFPRYLVNVLPLHLRARSALLNTVLVAVPIVLALWIALWGVCVLRLWRHQCPNCGYSRKGIPSLCPECGFDPAGGTEVTQHSHHDRWPGQGHRPCDVGV